MICWEKSHFVEESSNLCVFSPNLGKYRPRDHEHFLCGANSPKQLLLVIDRSIAKKINALVKRYILENYTIGFFDDYKGFYQNWIFFPGNLVAWNSKKYPLGSRSILELILNFMCYCLLPHTLTLTAINAINGF